MNSLTDKQIKDILDYVMFNTTEQMANIKIKNEGNHLSSDICTVNTFLEGNCDATLSLFADKSFLVRLTQQILQIKDVTQQDIEDTAKEYLNVICGRFIAKVFHLINKPTRFKIPFFQTGKHLCNNNAEHCYKSYYINNYNESILLVLQFSILMNA